MSFAYVAPIASVSLVGDYIEKPVAPTTQLIPKDLFDEQIHYYAVLLSASPPHHLTLINRAAEFGQQVVQGKGTTLNYQASLKRQRLIDGKVLVLGVFNASRKSNDWLTVEAAGDRLDVRKNGQPESKRESGLYQLETGGLKINIDIHSGPDDPGDVEYMFFAPE